MGKPFDPNYHEAVMTVENFEYPDQTVIEEIRKGYIKDDKVIRPPWSK
jgi:molecular chaperone GrpE